MKSTDVSPPFLAIALPLLLLSPAVTLLAGTKVSVGRVVAASQQVSMDQIDHSVWDSLLKHYVDASGNVNYSAWKQSATDLKSLDAYLNSLSSANPNAPATEAAKLAFWINAYNAVTVHGILREYPTTSIRNHTAKLVGYNIWKDLLLTVGGKPYSLNQMEHEVLRKLGEPRVHFAIVCASRSCPRLLAEAYTKEKLGDRLTLNSQVFFANPENFRYDPARRSFQLSSILDWFGEDFGSTQAEQLRTIAPYLPTREAYAAAIANSVSVSHLDYDWGLNDQASARTASR